MTRNADTSAVTFLMEGTNLCIINGASKLGMIIKEIIEELRISSKVPLFDHEKPQPLCCFVDTTLRLIHEANAETIQHVLSKHDAMRFLGAQNEAELELEVGEALFGALRQEEVRRYGFSLLGNQQSSEHMYHPECPEEIKVQLREGNLASGEHLQAIQLLTSRLEEHVQLLRGQIRPSHQAVTAP